MFSVMCIQLPVCRVVGFVVVAAFLSYKDLLYNALPEAVRSSLHLTKVLIRCSAAVFSFLS